jgi:hypothetical protein
LNESDDDCGACVGYWSEVSETAEHFLVATEGSLEITEVAATVGSAFRGTVSGVTMVELGEDGPVAGGCSVTLDSLTFDVTLAAEMAE